jgi:type I restriction enzyme M protein
LRHGHVGDAASQQLGILFLERCFKLLADNGRIGIILPEGYLCTPKYGYVRQWLTEKMRIVALVELPRRVFLKSNADLRANILILQKKTKKELTKLVEADYPIFAELVRNVGYKLGQGFALIPRRDVTTGVELRDENNMLIPDSDFDGVQVRFSAFVDSWLCWESVGKQISAFESWKGGRISDVIGRVDLDLKPRRLTHNALRNKRELLEGDNVKLGDVADIVTERFDLTDDAYAQQEWRIIKGLDIRAIEGIVVPQYPLRAWQIIERESASMYKFNYQDIVIGLVRPERRNIGIITSNASDLLGAPDGVMAVRPKPNLVDKYPLGWLFESMRSECVRIQLWTESGGTSYGKLTEDDILNVILPVPSPKERKAANARFDTWFDFMKAAMDAWNHLGSEDDRRPIINSPILGLESVEFD